MNLNSDGSLGWSGRLRFLWEIFGRYRWWAAGLLALDVLASGLNALIPYFTKLQVDQLQEKANTLWFFEALDPMTVFAILVIVPACLEVIRLIVFRRSVDVWSTKFGNELRISAETKLWEKLRTLDAAFFTNMRNQIILRSAFESARVSQAAWQFVTMRVRNISTLIVVIPILGLIGWKLLALVVISSAVQTLISRWFRKKSATLLALWDLSIDKFWFLESLLMRDFVPLQILGVADKFLNLREKSVRERDRLSMQRELLDSNRRQYGALVSELLTVAVNVFVGIQVLGGAFTVGTFTIMVSYTLQLNRTLGDWLESLQDWQEMDLQFDRLGFFFSLRSRMKRGGKEKINRLELLTVDKVSFRYPDFSSDERAYAEMLIRKMQQSTANDLWSKRQLDDWKKMIETKEEKPLVLNEVDLELRPGRIAALLGRNGAGKTTLTNLLMRLYEPNGGQVLLNGKSLEFYDSSWLHRQYAVVQQWPLMLQRYSIRENLMLGVDEDVKDEKLWELLRNLDLDQVIKSLPRGLETTLGEEYSLSGGQSQLLAVGRALLQRRPVVIFDEGMSQLDIEHETKVLGLLKEQAVKYKAAVLFITHRITTARKADIIYMLDQGKIVEEGSHQELMNKHEGLYAKFWEMQVVG